MAIVKDILKEVLTSKIVKSIVFKQIGEDTSNELPFVSQQTKELMLGYYEDKEKSIKIAKKLWQEMLIDAICILKINDPRELLYSHSKESLKKNTFSNDFNKIRMKSSYGIDKLGEYFEDFVKYESVLYGTDKYYRDHVNHLLQVWAIGISILFDEKKQFLQLQFSEKITFHDSNFHFEIPTNKDSDNKRKLSKSELWAMWTIIALCHDLGYPIEKTSQINQAARKIINHFGCLNFEELNFSFGIFNGFIVEKFLNIISSKISHTGQHTVIQSKYRDKLSKSLEEFKHGIFSSLLIFKNLTYFLETDFAYENESLSEDDLKQFYIRKEVLRAIAGHTCPKLYHVNLNTLSFLLILSDELQEWDRPNFDDIRMNVSEDDLKVQIRECSLNSDAQNIKIEFTYSKSDQKLKDHILENRFRHMHYLLRSAPYDGTRKIKFTWTVEFGDKTFYEFDFDSTRDSFNLTLVQEYKKTKTGKKTGLKDLDLYTINDK